MDYFTTNWTEKMKTNPVANVILNPKATNQVRLTWWGYIPNEDVLVNAEEYSFVDIAKRAQVAEYYYDPKEWKEPKFWGTQLMKNMVVEKSKANELARHEEDPSQVFANERKIDSGDYGNNEFVELEKHVDHQEYFNNTIVQDYINIHHPKLRLDYVQAIKAQPLQIKPPSVFFSDI